MSILQTLLEISKASFTLTAILQLAVTSLVGFIVVKAVLRQSAPLRSLVAISVMILLALTLIVSAAFRLSNVSWYRAAPSSIEAVTVMPEVPASASAEISSTPSRIQNPNILTPSGQRFVVSREQIFMALSIIWLSGALVMIFRICYGLVFIRGFKYELTPIKNAHFDIMLTAAAQKFGRNKIPSLYISSKIETPVTTGVSNPIVVIPERLFGKLNANEMQSIMLHELAHIYSCDHLIGILKRIIIAANWWNPLVYIISA